MTATPPPDPLPASGAAVTAADTAQIPNAPPTEARPRSSSAGIVIATVAVGAVLWAAQDLFLPVLLAGFFALVGNPIIRALQRLLVPRFLGALLVLFAGLASTYALGEQLVQPAAEWVRQVPRELRSIAPKLQQVAKPVQDASKAAQNIARAAGGESASQTVRIVRTEPNDPYKVLTSTPKYVASVLAVILLTFFFMVYGQSLQKNVLGLLPSRQQKKLTIDILQSIEHEISRYVLTISVINSVVGLVFGGILHLLLGVPAQEALLWGTMAAILNFAPYVGPLIGILVMLLMGFVMFDELWQSLMPAGIYLTLHTLEGQILTPIVLGRRMRLSPLVLILALMVFGWLWGIIGLLLAVPLLVCVKLVLSRVEGMDGWARLLE